MTDQTASYQHLPWDTAFFGFNVSKITQRILTEEQLLPVLDELRSQKCCLTYWQADESVPSLIGSLIASQGGLLVDMKATFVRDLDTVPPLDPDTGMELVPYNPSMPVSDMVSLAIQSGLYSRFAVDPRIPPEKFESLYSTWIRRSIAREIAEEVLVIYDGVKICGMITLGNKDGRGDIGLVAVDEGSRGKKIGQKLVTGAMHWFISRGYTTSQVVTQSQNLAAGRLYEKCGYHVETIDPYYHIWL